jgi:hypothetical protein
MSRPPSNPDWYRVKYSLATERLNRALAAGDELPAQLKKAEVETRELLKAIVRWLRRPKQWGLRAIRDSAGREMDSFLRDHLQPSALVLLAGIELEQAKAAGGKPNPNAATLELGELRAQICEGAAVDPFVIVRTVEAHWEEPPVGISYNLACFQAQAGLPRIAVERLRDCVEATAPSTWPQLRARAESDPALEPVRGELDDLFVDDPLGSGAKKRKSRTWHFRL